jgi:hypothetical protein
MGFAVTRTGGMKDAEFRAYSRLLRQHGMDLGNIARVPEPGTNRRWLHLHGKQEDAQRFAKELKKRTGQGGWEVAEVSGCESQGPLGPVLILLTRRGDGLTFGVDLLSDMLIRSAFPKAFGCTHLFIHRDAWEEFRTTRGNLEDLVRQFAPALTGLTGEQLESVGYAVIDDESEETMLFVPPAVLCHT